MRLAKLSAIDCLRWYEWIFCEIPTVLFLLFAAGKVGRILIGIDWITPEQLPHEKQMELVLWLVVWMVGHVMRRLWHFEVYRKFVVAEINKAMGDRG